MTIVLNNAADVLDAAANHLEEHGWCRGHFFNDQGHHCALGAINLVTSNYRDRVLRDSAVNLLMGFVVQDHSQLHIGKGSIISWNDALRDKRVVIRTFRRLARERRAANS